jgi:hypothetical protein
LYKQATAGNCNASQPWAYQIEARAKWGSWHAHFGKLRLQAKAEYVELLSSLQPTWDDPGKGDEGVEESLLFTTVIATPIRTVPGGVMTTETSATSAESAAAAVAAAAAVLVKKKTKKKKTKKKKSTKSKIKTKASMKKTKTKMSKARSGPKAARHPDELEEGWTGGWLCDGCRSDFATFEEAEACELAHSTARMQELQLEMDSVAVELAAAKAEAERIAEAEFQTARVAAEGVVREAAAKAAMPGVFGLFESVFGRY